MSKLQDKRIALAKKILDTTDPMTLARVEHVLGTPLTYKVPEEEIKLFEEQLERYERGEEKTSSWPEVKRRLLRKARK